jgi:hypothetical protein
VSLNLIQACAAEISVKENQVENVMMALASTVVIFDDEKA